MFSPLILSRILTLSALSAGLVLAWGPVAKATGLSAEVQASAQRRVELGLNPGLALVYLKKGQPAEIKTWGKVAWGPEAPSITPATRFEIGSVTKVLTALQAALMVEQKVLQPETTLQQLWPESWGELAPSLQPLTLSSLLTHSSGLPRLPDNFAPADPSNPYADYDQDALQAFMQSHQLATQPPAYAYSNLAYGLSGVLLAAQTSSLSYTQLLEQDLLQPLQMQHSSFAALPAEWMAQGHFEGVAVKNWDFSESTAGAGALKASAQDMAKFLQAQLEPPDNELGRAIRRSHQILYAAEGQQRMAYGWHIAQSQGRDIYWHNGQTGGYLSFAAFDPATGQAAAVLTNNTDAIQDLGMRLLGVGPPLPSLKDQRLPEKTLAAYVGVYALAPGVELHVSQQAGYLVVQVTGQAALRVFPGEAPHHFAYRVVEAEMVFSANAQGQINGLTFRQNGAEHTAPRLN